MRIFNRKYLYKLWGADLNNYAFLLAICTWYGISPNFASSPFTILGSKYGFKIPATMWQIIITVCKIEDIKKF